MRTIDADALIIDLMDAGLDQIQMGDYSEVIQVIERQPTVNPWHRVEEPPKEDGKYLVYMFTSAWRWEFKFASYLHGRWIGAGGGDVRYWMPIEPPKEEEHGN